MRYYELLCEHENNQLLRIMSFDIPLKFLNVSCVDQTWIKSVNSVCRQCKMFTKLENESWGSRKNRAILI